MRALLMGLVSGYFFTACAPVHWSSERTLFLVGCFAVAVVLYFMLRQREQAGWGSGLIRVLRSALLGLIGGMLGCMPLAYYLHLWQRDTLAQTESQPVGDCRSSTQRQLLRLEVVGLPSRTAEGSRLDARVLAQRYDCLRLLGQHVRVSWKAARWPVAGMQILAEVRVRAVRGSVSPGAFDHELHLARRGIRYSAYIVQTFSVTAPRPNGAGKIARVRLMLRHKFAALPLEHSGILLALLTGDSSLLTRERWELLQDTGTVHLLVISGLHVGLVAGGLLLLIRGIGRVVRFWLPTSPALGRFHDALLLMLLLSGYVLFVGAGIAAVRALVMFGVVILAWSSGRAVLTSALLTLLLGVVVLTDPGAGLTPGFWLSFGLVAWLILREVPVRWSLWRALFSLHLGCTLVLLPVLAWLGLPIAIVGPLANLVSVPVVTLLLVPLVLVGGVLLLGVPRAGEVLLQLADQVAAVLLTGLKWITAVVPEVHVPMLSGIGYLAVGVVILTVLLPAPGRLRIGLATLLALGLGVSISTENRWCLLRSAATAKLAPGEFGVQLLDVGQGLAIIVTTRNQTLLYDTGASFPSGFNYADAVILPALKIQGLRRLDVAMISHHDLDHAGSLAQILTRFSPQRRIGVTPGLACRAGAEPVSWQSDGVSFEVLQAQQAQTSNNRSCVLVVRGARSTALLAGDIEAASERLLLSQLPGSVDLLVVPHHGSQTSSTPEFVAWLRPQLAVISAGFGNRFGHPHPHVVARYTRAGACVLNTAYLGTIEWRSDWPANRVRAQRRARGRAWKLGAPLIWSEVWTRGRAEQLCGAARESKSPFRHR